MLGGVFVMSPKMNLIKFLFVNPFRFLFKILPKFLLPKNPLISHLNLLLRKSLGRKLLKMLSALQRLPLLIFMFSFLFLGLLLRATLSVFLLQRIDLSILQRDITPGFWSIFVLV